MRTRWLKRVLGSRTSGAGAAIALGLVAVSIVGASGAAAATPVDLTGTWNCCKGGGAAAQDFVITAGAGSLAGKGVLPGGQVFAAITGSVSGNKVTIVTTYNSFAPGYVATFVGTLAAGGNSMSGTWTSNRGQAGTWTASRAGGRPSIAVSISLPDGGATIGAVVPVSVRVTAGEVPLKAVTLGRGLVAAGPVAEVTSRPSGLSGFTLPAHASKVFAFKVKAKEPGAAALRASASARSTEGPLSGSGAATLRVAKAELAITIATAPGKVALEASDKGKVLPKDAVVTIRLTNASKVSLKNVSLASLNPEPVDKTERLDQLRFARGALPLEIGTMAPRSTATRKLTLKVTGDGKYQLRALALYANAAGGTARATAVGGTFEATVPILYFRSEIDATGRNDRPVVKGGKAFFISGLVKNLSSYKTLCVLPLDANMVGNVYSSGPVDIEAYRPRDNAPPLAGGLLPGHDFLWSLSGGTTQTGGTRASLRFTPRGVAVKRGESCDLRRVLKLKPLAPKEMKLAAKSTDYVLAVDQSSPVLPPLHPVLADLFFFNGIVMELGATPARWYFRQLDGLQGVGQATGTMMMSSIALAREMVRQGVTIDDVLGAPGRLAAGSIAVIDGIEYAYTLPFAAAYTGVHRTAEILANYWRTASADEKKHLYSQALSVLRRSSYDGGLAAYDGIESLIEPAFASWFGKVESAYANGNDPEVWAALGRPIGAGLGDLGMDWLAGEAVLRVARQTKALEAAFRRVGASSVTYKTLKEIPPGKILNPTELKRLWGFAGSDIAAFTRIAREEGVVIGIRGRAPISVKNLEKGAVWKHENLKPKNVSRIDRTYLGFSAKDDGLVAFKRYSEAEKKAIRKRIADAPLTDTQRAEVLERWKIRQSEADDYLAKLEKLDAGGEIDVGFQYAENGLPDVATTSSKRAFKLVEEPSGSGYFKPYQENLGLQPGAPIPPNCKQLVVKAVTRVLCRVTGDMDGVYLTSKLGTALTRDKVLAVYRKLAAAGWQHPETFTWVDQMGAFWFERKEKILAGLGPLGEAMAEFAPDGLVRATVLDLDKTRRLSTGTRAWWLFAHGGYAVAHHP
jgi:hypothetical protein